MPRLASIAGRLWARPYPEGQSSELQTLREEGRPRPSPLLHPTSPPQLCHQLSALCWDRSQIHAPLEMTECHAGCTKLQQK